MEHQLTYMINPSLVAGMNLVFDAKNSKVTKYDVGTTWEAANRLFVGLRHETSNKEKMALGKTFLLFFHQASAIQTIGSEFSLDHASQTVGARFGLIHAFSPDFTGKFKVNNNGYLDAVLKLRLNDRVTVGFASGLDLKGIPEAKSRALPVGLSFDLKL